MINPDPSVDEIRQKFDRERAAAQGRTVPGAGALTYRDLANALTLLSVRNNPLFEQLHGGKWSPLLTDPSLSRISQNEMKKLMVEISADLAYRLWELLEEPEQLTEDLGYARSFTRDWEREAISCQLPQVADEVSKCSKCSEALVDDEWHFCPACGTELRTAT